jgi:hypothetical protein
MACGGYDLVAQLHSLGPRASHSTTTGSHHADGQYQPCMYRTDYQIGGKSTMAKEVANYRAVANYFPSFPIAATLSYLKWHSLGWAVLHGLCGWYYIVYFVNAYIYHFVK